MKITKKLLALALAVMLLLSLAVPAMAADSDFTIENGVLKEYKGSGGDVTIPNSVTSIGDMAFMSCSSLTSVTIPNSVTSIGHVAFGNCSSLTSVTIPNSVTSIGNTAFSGCESMTSVTISNSVTSIGISVFSGCMSLTSVIIPSGVTSIGFGAFELCPSMTSVTIPSSVTSIGKFAFNQCDNLTDVYYGGSEEQWKKIKIDDNNDLLLGATIHYNSTGPDAPTAPTTPTTPTTPTVTEFADVPANAWYAEPVKWALEKGITNGTGNNTFSPNKTCNNSEILTFLWRACGKPEIAASASLSDVPSGAWYADAAKWAKTNGMISGDKLSPETPCTRASAVMFIWQACGKPAASKAASFSDVDKNADYAAAVAWAVEKGVTNGTGADTFSPDTICTRGHIVTFLQRAFA